MGSVGVNNLNGSSRISSLLYSQELQKESIAFKYTDLPLPIISLAQKNFLDFVGASAQIAKNLLPASSASEAIKIESKRKKIEFLKLHNCRALEFDLKLENEVVINGMALFLDDCQKEAFKQGKGQNQKWTVYFNNNDEVYEDKLAHFQSVGKDFDANILVFNYRTTGESSGDFSRIENPIVDGELCMQYLLSRGVYEKDMLILGHAFGGALATFVAEMHEKIGLICDRCFSMLSRAASARIPFSGQFLSHFGWDVDVAATFDKIKAKKLIIYHKQDGVVPYQESSLYKFLKEKIKQSNPAATEPKLLHGTIKNCLKDEYKPKRVKLRNPFDTITDNAHFYPLSEDQTYGEIKKIVRGFFNNENLQE